MRDIHTRADAILATHFRELMYEAAQRVANHPEWLPKRARPSVAITDNAKSGTEKTQLFNTTSAIFRGSRLLFTF
jgi:hypothetical protein